MNDLDRILDNCLEQLLSGTATIDECLARHPWHTAELRPLLGVASKLEHTEQVSPSLAVRVHARKALIAHMNAHPRRRALPGAFSPFSRLAFGLAVLLLAFAITGTAMAQSALPGAALYPWKLASERAWRAVSIDPVGTDLAIAGRRVAEIQAESNDPVERKVAIEGYDEVLSRLAGMNDSSVHGRIQAALKKQAQDLAQSGVDVPELHGFSSGGKAPAGPPTPSISIPSQPDPAPTDIVVLPTQAGPNAVPPINIPPAKLTPQVPHGKPTPHKGKP